MYTSTNTAYFNEFDSTAFLTFCLLFISEKLKFIRDFTWWPNIKQLSLRINNHKNEDGSLKKEVTEFLKTLEQYGKLETFNLFIYDDPLPLERLSPFLLNYKNLKSSKNLCNQHSQDDSELTTIVKAKKAKLEELNLKIPSLESELFLAIVDCVALKRLKLQIKKASKLQLKPLTGLQSLTFLELSMKKPMKIFFPMPPNCFPNLKELKIISNDGNDSFVLNLVAACPNLTSLDFKSDSSSFKSDEMKKILQNCQNVEFLSFRLPSTALEILGVFKDKSILLPNILYLNLYYRSTLRELGHEQIYIFDQNPTLLAINLNDKILIGPRTKPNLINDILRWLNPRRASGFKQIQLYQPNSFLIPHGIRKRLQ